MLDRHCWRIMKKLVVLFALVHLTLGASIADVTCPDSCTCQQQNDEYMEASCTSYDFLQKLLPKQISTIVRLNLSNASLVNIDSKLSKLKNVDYIDLSNNKINILPTKFPYLPKLELLNLSANILSNLNVNEFPPNIEILDLSNNSLNNLPKTILEIKHLKTLYINNNPFDCDCHSLSIYDELLKNGVKIPEKLLCYYPKEFYGQTFDSVNCSMITNNLLNVMLADEGSGYIPREQPEEDQFKESGDLSDGDELLSADDHKHHQHSDEADNNNSEQLEGSGDEGSGAYEIPIEPIIPVERILPNLPAACHFNCTTPRPVGLEDVSNASPPPSIKEGLQIMFEDVFNKSNNSGEDKLESGEKNDLNNNNKLKEETFHKKEVDEFVEKNDKKKMVEKVPTNTTVLGEMERASLHDTNSNSIYIIVGLIVAFVALIAIYTMKKRNKSRANAKRRNKTNENGFGEEMKPLGKSAEKQAQINSKLPIVEKYENEKAPVVETAPLLNGQQRQNGKINENDLKPQLSINSLNDNENDFDDAVEVRNKARPNLYTPQPERVTIIAGEIPDSIPKTPLLVHRQKNGDGQVISTPILN